MASPWSLTSPPRVASVEKLATWAELGHPNVSVRKNVRSLHPSYHLWEKREIVQLFMSILNIEIHDTKFAKWYQYFMFSCWSSFSRSWPPWGNASYNLVNVNNLLNDSLTAFSPFPWPNTWYSKFALRAAVNCQYEAWKEKHAKYTPSNQHSTWKMGWNNSCVVLVWFPDDRRHA